MDSTISLTQENPTNKNINLLQQPISQSSEFDQHILGQQQQQFVNQFQTCQQQYLFNYLFLQQQLIQEHYEYQYNYSQLQQFYLHNYMNSIQNSHFNQEKLPNMQQPLCDSQFSIQNLQNPNSISSLTKIEESKDKNLSILNKMTKTMNQNKLAQNKEQDSNKKLCKFKNDSNYTKNILKGFKRVIKRKYGYDKQFQTDFLNYFNRFKLNNEFILILFDNSLYKSYFEQFLNSDPTWWIRIAKIKDIQKQLNVLEICKNKQYHLIKTKRKKFIRPIL